MPPSETLCQYQGGLYVPALDLWLDDTQPHRRGFISHAHTDHYAAHETIICTPETAEMLNLVKPFGEELPPCRPMATGRTVQHNGAHVTLLPSGHILGAAMLHVEAGGTSVLYSGDVRPAGSLTAPPAQVLCADHLIVEDTFGDLEQSFVTPREGGERVVAFCTEALAMGATPIVVTTGNCGKAQEMTLALAEAGLTTALQPKIFHFARTYERLGIPLRGYAKLAPGEPAGQVVVVTRAYLEHNDLQEWIPRPRYALVSGWAASDEARDYDAAIPWSDHASRQELLAFIEAVNPSLVWTFAGSGRLAEELRAAGREARHLGG